jgi:homoserine O-acetyltransferase
MTTDVRVPAMSLALIAALGAAPEARGASHPPPQERTWIAHDVRFASGETLPGVRLHYRTLGSAVRDAQGVVRNAVLILHGTGGSGAQFLQPQFAEELFGPGQLLDAARYYIVLPDGIGHGDSSKPSDGLRMRFPRYAYADMVALQHRLLTEGLGVNHLRLVMGTSMGGMHTWVWGYTYPDFMDGLVPLASVPTAIVGRNRIWRKMLMDSIRDDPSWNEGNYAEPPRLGLRNAQRLLLLMGAAPLQWQTNASTRESADTFLKEQIERRVPTADADDMLYQFDASREYDPSPHLERITAPVLAINSADDQINPPDLGLMERLMPRVRNGRYVLIPTSDRTRGHGTHTWAAVWKEHLARFLGSADEPMRVSAVSSAAKEVEEAERKLVAAISARDLETYDTLVADDYVVLRPTGNQTKAQVMADYRASALEYRGLGIRDVEVRVYGETAVLSAWTEGTRVEKGRETPNRVRYLRVWHRREGVWRAVLQMSVLAGITPGERAYSTSGSRIPLTSSQTPRPTSKTKIGAK